MGGFLFPGESAGNRWHPSGTIGWGLSPHRIGAGRRLSQASLRRLLLAPILPCSMLEHVFNKNSVASGAVLYEYVGYGTY